MTSNKEFFKDGPPCTGPYSICDNVSLFLQVFSQGKDHALYLWIELTPSANPKEVAKVCATLQKMVDKVTDPSMKDEADEIWAGVGFGPTFFKQVNFYSWSFWNFERKIDV